MISVRVTGDISGIEQAETIIAQSLRGGLIGLGKLIQRSIRSRVRRFKGDEERSVKYEVKGRGMALTLDVYSELVQAIVDQNSLPPGTFPPYRRGSRLFRWVRAKGMVETTERREQHNFGVKRRPRRVSHVYSRTPERSALLRARATRSKGRRAAPPPQQGQTKRPSTKREKRIERMAFLVARSIYERGIRATKPFTKGFDANQGRIMRELQNAVSRAVNRINRGG